MDESFWILQSDKVLAALNEGKRLDGRNFDEYRKVEVKKNISLNAEGSARVKLGGTEVVAGIKLGIGEPYPDLPDAGGLSTGVELLPAAAPEFEAGPPGEESIEIARVVDRAIRESKSIDLKSLCIREGELCYIVFLDFYVVNHDGNLFDACAIAGLASLLDCKVPKVEDDKIVPKEYVGKLKIQKKPMLCSFAKIKNHIVLDPGLEEDMVLDARFHCGVTEDDLLVAFQKGGNGSFKEKEINDAIDIALRESKKIRKLL